MKAVVAAFNQEKALVGAFSVITNLRMDLFEALFLVVQEVLVLLQTKLERARLVERARLALVRGVHHGLQHALVKLGQVDRVVRHNLHSKISFTTLDYGLQILFLTRRIKH